MRVFVGALHHESNSLSPIITRAEDFRVLRDVELIQSIKPNDSLSGIIETLLAEGYEVIPSVSARAIPNGLVDYEFYQSICDEMIEKAIQAYREKPLDAITLSLHGSMRVHGFGEAEGPLLERFRQQFPTIPIYCSLDMHATMTELMHQHADGFVGYKTAPHVDCTETGQGAAKLTIKRLSGNTTTSAWVRIPFLIAGEQSATTTQPMIGLIEAVREVEQRPGVLSASLLMGFPWADHGDSGCSIYVVTDDDPDLARKLALELAELVWSKRREFSFVSRALPMDESIDYALNYLKTEPGPIYLSDSGDNPTAGSSADNTEFLRLLLKDKRVEKLSKPILYGGFFDPAATKACAGRVGKEITLTFGSAFDDSSKPITAQGVVRSYETDWSKHGFPKGDLALFETGGLSIVLAEQHVGFTDPVMLNDLGLEPDTAGMIICKLGYLTPEHEALAKDHVLVLTPGNTNQLLETIAYKEIPRPMFPLDEFEYDPRDYLNRGKTHE